MPVPDYVLRRRANPNNPLKLRAQAANLTMIEKDIIPSTRRAHEACLFAREQGAEDKMHASLLTRYWTRGEDLYSLETLRGAAVDGHGRRPSRK